MITALCFIQVEPSAINSAGSAIADIPGVRAAYSVTGEIDLIARDGAVLVFVEVRSRRAGSQVSAAASITPAKQAKIRKTALAYLQQHHPQPPDCRFDAICIDGTQITWLKGIF